MNTCPHHHLPLELIAAYEAEEDSCSELFMCPHKGCGVHVVRSRPEVEVAA